MNRAGAGFTDVRDAVADYQRYARRGKDISDSDREWCAVQAKRIKAAMKAQPKPVSTGLHGVVNRNNKARPYSAQLWHDGTSEYLGSFETAIEAAHAYDAASWARFHDVGRLNFPNEVTA